MDHRLLFTQQVVIPKAALMALFAWTLYATASHGVSKDYPYPSPTRVLNAQEIANQVYFVNHVYGVRNLAQEKQKNRSPTIIDKSQSGKITTTIFERYLNNDYSDGIVRARDLAIFRSGKLRGTGVLTTIYEDENKTQAFAIWLPQMRKIRRHAQPPRDDAWGGSNLTYGDMYLRKPDDETHTLLGVETFNECLGAISVPAERRKGYLEYLPEPQCGHKARSVYKLESRTKFRNWWYDYRTVYIDTESFADYRSIYYTGDRAIKVIDKDWASMGLNDPRAQYARYWYARTENNGRESMYLAPEGVTRWNIDLDPSLWTEKSLRRIRR